MRTRKFLNRFFLICNILMILLVCISIVPLVSFGADTSQNMDFFVAGKNVDLALNDISAAVFYADSPDDSETFYSRDSLPLILYFARASREKLKELLAVYKGERLIISINGKESGFCVISSALSKGAGDFLIDRGSVDQIKKLFADSGISMTQEPLLPDGLMEDVKDIERTMKDIEEDFNKRLEGEQK